jgi:hypothetical protein
MDEVHQRTDGFRIGFLKVNDEVSVIGEGSEDTSILRPSLHHVQEVAFKIKRHDIHLPCQQM